MEKPIKLSIGPIQVQVTIAPEIRVLIPQVADHLGFDISKQLSSEFVTELFEALIEDKMMDIRSEIGSTNSEDSSQVLGRILDPDLSMGVEITPGPIPQVDVEDTVTAFNKIAEVFKQDLWVRNVLNKAEDQDNWKRAFMLVRQGLSESRWGDAVTWILIERTYRLISSQKASGG